MDFKLNWLAILALALTTGCQTPTTQNNPSDNKTHGANHIDLVLHYFVGIFGDGQPAWYGRFFIKENLSIVAHLPTKSEFFIYVRRPEDEKSDITNNLHLIVDRIKEKSGGTEVSESWEKITQRIDIGNEKDRLIEFNYLRAEFVGTRADTDSYSKTDRVVTVIYTTCFTPERPASKAVYSVAIAMIPVDVPREEKERLEGVLRNFLSEKIHYFL